MSDSFDPEKALRIVVEVPPEKREKLVAEARRWNRKPREIVAGWLRDKIDALPDPNAEPVPAHVEPAVAL